MAMECLEGCKKLLSDNGMSIIWVAHWYVETFLSLTFSSYPSLLSR